MNRVSDCLYSGDLAPIDHNDMWIDYLELLDLSDECQKVYGGLVIDLDGKEYDFESLYDVLNLHFGGTGEVSFNFIKRLLHSFENKLPSEEGIGPQGVRIYRLYTFFTIARLLLLDE